jgi:hypothetical protein
VDNERKLVLWRSLRITAKLGNETGNILLVIGVGSTVAPRRIAISVLAMYDEKRRGSSCWDRRAIAPGPGILHYRRLAQHFVCICRAVNRNLEQPRLMRPLGV